MMDKELGGRRGTAREGNRKINEKAVTWENAA